MSENGRLRRVGALWKPREGAKSLGSGSVTVNGLRQRFVVLRNDRKQKSTEPDYVLVSGDEPQVDQYATGGASRRTAPTTGTAFEQTTAPVAPLADEDLPW